MSEVLTMWWIIGILGMSFLTITMILIATLLWESSQSRQSQADQIEAQAIKEHLDAEEKTTLKVVK